MRLKLPIKFAIFGVLILVISCKKNPVILNVFDKGKVFEGRIIASDTKQGNKCISALIRNKNKYYFEYFIENKSHTTPLPFNDSIFNDSTKLFLYLKDNYFFDFEGKNLYFVYESFISINGNLASNYDFPKLVKFNLNTGIAEWSKNIYFPQYWNSFVLGEFQNNIQLLYSRGNYPYFDTYFLSYSTSNGQLNDSAYVSDINSVAAAYSNNDKIYLIENDYSFDDENNLFIYDKNYNRLSKHSISTNEMFFGYGFNFDLDDSTCFVPVRSEYNNFTILILNTINNVTETASISIPAVSWAEYVTKLDNQNYMAIGYTGIPQNYLIPTTSGCTLAFIEINSDQNTIRSYHEFDYENGLKYISSIYLGGKRFRILAESGSLHQSSPNHILIEIDLDKIFSQ